MSEPSVITSFDGTSIAVLTSESIDDRSRPLAVCAHGFPDTAHTWRLLAPRLEEAGMRVAMPFLRGYAPSGVPDDGCVQTAASALDLGALHDAFGGDGDAVVIGHDWGASIAHLAANHEPQRWGRVVTMAVPPGGAVGAAFLTNTDQLKRSWYMFFFQHPLAELVVPADDLAFVDMIWRDWSPGHDGAADVAVVKDSLRDPAHLAAALGYYRATLGGVGVRDELAEVQALAGLVPSQPLLYLHGADDGCIGVEVADAAAAEVGDNVTVLTVDDVGHFLHLEAPDLVNRHILEFLT